MLAMEKPQVQWCLRGRKLCPNILAVPVKWSHTISLSRRSLACLFWVASRTSQTSASLTPVLHFSLFAFSSHLSLSLCVAVSDSLSLSLQLRSFSPTLVTNSSCQSQRRKRSEHVIFRGSEGNLRRNLSSLFQQSTLSSDFCLYDKRIMAPCFKCTKGCFVPLNHRSRTLLSDVEETSNDDVSVIISVGCNCIVFFTSVSSLWSSSTFSTHVFHLIKPFFWMNNRPGLYWVFFFLL